MATLLSLLLFLTSLAHGANVNLTSTGCADAGGLQSCQEKANEQTSAGINQANRDRSHQEILACGCQNYVDNYNCYAAFCWNRVWECEYQEYIISYLSSCLTGKLPVPYFPAPPNVPDGCSCNLGMIYIAINDAIQETATCSNNANSGDASSNVPEIRGCNCCEISGALSSIVEICPATDPSLIELSRVDELESELDTQFSSCSQYLDTYDCVSVLSYSLEGVSTFYKPDDTLQTGTATLSNGQGTLTTPASGAIFTYTNGGDGIVYTIAAASVSAVTSGEASPGTRGSGSQQSQGTSTSLASMATETTARSGSSATTMDTSSSALMISCLVRAIIYLW